MNHEGGCLCGDLRFMTTGDPQRIVICHCHFCQKATSGPYAIEPFFLKTDFSLLRGEPGIYEHRSSASGKALYLHFCRRCGTRVYTVFERYADVMSIYGGTFDDPEWFEGSGPLRHVFVSSARSGTIIPPNVAVYQQGSFTPDGSPNTAITFAEFHVVQARKADNPL